MTEFLTHRLDGAIENLCRASLPAEWVLDHWAYPDGGGIVMLAAPLAGPSYFYRVVDGGIVERDGMDVALSATTIAADGVAECVLSGLPDPCTVTITGAVLAGPLTITGGSLTLTSTTPGAIAIRVTADPAWKPWEATIHAT